MDNWRAFLITQKLHDEDYDPYKKETYIVQAPFTNEKIETTIIRFRNLVDNYSSVFYCLLAKFYETLLIQIYEFIDIDVLDLMRMKFKQRNDKINSGGKTSLTAPDFFEIAIVSGLKNIANETDAYKYVYGSVSTVTGITPNLFANFAREMASIELQYLYLYIDDHERNLLQYDVIQKYGRPLEIEYLSRGFDLKDYNLKFVLEFFDKMNNSVTLE